MLRSRANALLSVRRVTQINAGRKTAGIDGEVVVLPEEQAELADWMQNRAEPWTPKPVKRVYISKANGRRRPLGIPVIADRGLQALTLNALEPEWEARFEPRSYGFRSGRGCQDAIQAIFNSVSGKNAKRLWVLDADLAGAFDHLDHDHLLTSLGTFPGRGLIAQWLKAGARDLCMPFIPQRECRNPQMAADTASAMQQLRIAQWVTPVVTAVLIVLGAQQGEQQRPAQLLPELDS